MTFDEKIFFLKYCKMGVIYSCWNVIFGSLKKRFFFYSSVVEMNYVFSFNRQGFVKCVCFFFLLDTIEVNEISFLMLTALKNDIF